MGQSRYARLSKGDEKGVIKMMMRIKFKVAAAVLCAAVAAGTIGNIAVNHLHAAEPAPAKKTYDLDNLPATILDDSVGDWVVKRFAGNTAAGIKFYQGPALEIGGLLPRDKPGECVSAPDGTVYIMCGLDGGSHEKVVKVSPDGTLRLLMGHKGLIEGPLGECRAGHPVWNPKENTLYLVGHNCLRRVIEKPDGSKWVEVVAGIPYKAPPPKEYGKPFVPQNGPAKEAVFQSVYRGAVCNSRGTIFWLEDTGIRRIENGIVSSVPLKFMDGAKNFCFMMVHNLLSLGENDDTLYITDFYGRWKGNGRILRCDVRTGELKTVVWNAPDPKAPNIDKLKARKKDQRSWGTCDGPALTHCLTKGGIFGHYDRFHKALWIEDMDTAVFKWLKTGGDGWVRSVIGVPRPGVKPHAIHLLNSPDGIPGELFGSRDITPNNYIAGFDAKGGVYCVVGRNPAFWRAYNKKEANK
jgi:hypothetical protein